MGNFQKDSTHSVYDGVERYFAAVPEGMSMDDVATAFLVGYDVGIGPKEEDIEFTVRDESTNEEIDYVGLPDKMPIRVSLR